MLSKSQLSFVKSIHLKKFRKQYKLFIVEGYKSISEFIDSDYELSQLFYTPEFAPKVANFPQITKSYQISQIQLERISTLKKPSGILALFKNKQEKELKDINLQNEFTLVLDCIQDPGNLGTIIRTADWFNIKNIVCSLNSADCYNPKVVQATMGSLAHVNIHYTDLVTWLPSVTIKTYGALLNGTSLYKSALSDHSNLLNKHEGIIIMGNEGNGIHSDILPFINEAITIPGFGKAESLNVAIATALICSEIRRST